MVNRRNTKLLPRSFLAPADLDRSLKREAARRGMKQSQLIRQALTEWLLYQGVEQKKKERGKK